MRCVIYARYSSDGQREESVEGQLRECKEFAERHNITVLDSYIDRALSARTDDRPQFQKMIQDSAKKQFDVVLVWKLDRFSRNRFDSATYRAILKRNGVKVVSAKENISEGPEGIILEAMLDGMAEYYSAELSVKVKRGQKENALKGKANGGTIPFGYRINSERYYEIDPLIAQIVLEMFTRYADGETVKEISDDMNARNVFAATKYKYTNKSSMGNLFKNRRYIGEYRYVDTIIPTGMPAIVPQDIFDAVQARMEKNKHKPAATKADEEYPHDQDFRGKDGAMMVGVGGTSKVHHYYKCGNFIYKKTCDKKMVQKAWIERHIAALTCDYVLLDEVLTNWQTLLWSFRSARTRPLRSYSSNLPILTSASETYSIPSKKALQTLRSSSGLTSLRRKKADLEIALAARRLSKRR